jgi:hypothetical protein
VQVARPAHMEKLSNLRPYQVGIVVGVDHKIQRFVEDIAPSDPRNMLRLRFLDFLRDITRRCPVDAVCEESKLGAQSIAETVADREALRYRNINMPAQHRAELGIPLGYTSDVPGPDVAEEQKAKWVALHESYMIDEILEAVVGARAAVVICGVGHMRALADGLRTKFARVEQHDVTAMPWFDRALL